MQAETPTPSVHDHADDESHTPSPTEHMHSMHEGHTPSPVAEDADASGAEGAATDATNGAAGIIGGGGVAAVGKAFVSCAVALGAASVVLTL